jgi:transcriptional regulator with XRE-family HTH domain
LSSAAHQFKNSKLTSVNLFEFSKFVNRKTLTKLEKAKSLRDARKRIGWGQREMAEALGLDPTYLSQLENGRRDVDDFYVQRARAVAEEFEKSKRVKAGEEDEPAQGARHIRERCHGHLDRVLDECKGDHDQLAWTFVELKKRFPLRVIREPDTKPGGLSSISPSEAEASVAGAETAIELERRGSSPKRATGEPSEHKSEPSRGALPESKDKPMPPKPAPG